MKGSLETGLGRTPPRRKHGPCPAAGAKSPVGTRKACAHAGLARQRCGFDGRPGSLIRRPSRYLRIMARPRGRAVSPDVARILAWLLFGAGLLAGCVGDIGAS